MAEITEAQVIEYTQALGHVNKLEDILIAAGAVKTTLTIPAIKQLLELASYVVENYAETSTV